VAALLEVNGELKELAENEVHRAKMSVTCKLRYDERTLEVPTAAKDRLRLVRHYDEVAAAIRVGDDGVKPALRPERRLMVTQVDAGRQTMFSPHGPLTRDELELIDILGNTALLDRLLPAGPVAVGGSWRLADELLVALLGLDDAEKTNVQCKLTEVTAAAARFELGGNVEGAAGGVTTRIELKAKFRFNRTTKRIDWFGLLVKEDRDIGHVAAGIDALARLQVQLKPISLASSPKLTTGDGT
jgi:hypothetical protein